MKGLPQGLSFRKPTHYGKKQLQAIMESRNDIVFELETSSSHTDCDQGGAIACNDMETIGNKTKTILTKICGEEVAKRVLSGGPKVKEDEVEVVSLALDDQERMQLHKMLSYFEDDALLAIRENLLHIESVCGIVLPIYNLSEEEFWLFYTHIKSPKAIQSLSDGTTIRGYWLDRTMDMDDYKLLKQETTTKGKSIIKSELGRLYITENIDIKEGALFKPSFSFVTAILDTLRRQGLIKN